MPITALGPEDLEAAVALWERAGLTRAWNPSDDDFRRALHGCSSTILGLLEDGRLVGTAMVGHDGHRGWVYYLAVDPPSQRSGAGRQLMQAAERWLRDAGVAKVQLMVRRDNYAAATFYERLEYERADVEVFARWLDDA
jgi:ribosomal protein S18 acetylase RimI-like enzyme